MTIRNKAATMCFVLLVGAVCYGCQPWPPQVRSLEARYHEKAADFEQIHQIVNSEGIEIAFRSLSSEYADVESVSPDGKYSRMELETASGIALNKLLKNVHGSSVIVVDGEIRIKQLPIEARGVRYLVWYARSSERTEGAACERVETQSDGGSCRVMLDEAWSITYVW